MPDIVAIGIQDFEKIRNNKTLYVDKTYFIKDWWESGDDVTLITRPRRFGKTLNMSMLEYFFANYHENRGELFEGLSVWKDEKYRELQGTYPVIALSFAGVKSNNYDGAKYQIFEILKQVWSRYKMVEQDESISLIDKQIGINGKGAVDDELLSLTLNKLSKSLYDYYGKKVLIFLDEYDTPMQEAWISGYWDEIVNLFRNMFNNTFKTNPYMERAVITGITRVSKESIFSDLNNLEVITTTSEQYATAFGFTEAEVFVVLDKQGLGTRSEEVKAWYDGFKFGSVEDIYNPWSIINFLKKGILTTYWANTSANGLVGNLIRQGSPEVKQIMEDLLKGIPLVTEIDEQIIFNQLDENENAIWSMLLASGYLKVDNHVTDGDGLNEYTLFLTNFEVKRMFEKMISEWFRRGTSANYNGFIKSLLTNDVEDMNSYLEDVIYDCVSFHDVETERAQRSESEKFYHALVLGLLVELKGKYYVKSNRESGRGRYDVILEPEDKTGNAYVIEFKVFDSKKDKDLSDAADRALTQIEEKDYDAALMERGIKKEQIYHYGFAFKGKEVLIKQGVL